MSTLNHVHQAGLFDPRHARRTTVIGVGAVGSVVCDTLCKIGVNDLTVWDDDTVASHNHAMSLYRPQDTGKFKVRALAEIVRQNSGVDITTHERKYAGEPLRHSSVVACVHDMPTRKMIWEQVRMNPGVDIFCDTRTAGAYIETYAINPCERIDIDRYEVLLFDESERVQHTCGNHGIMYGSLIAAAAVVSNLTRYWSTGVKRWRFPIQCDTLSQVA